MIKRIMYFPILLILVEIITVINPPGMISFL